MGVRVRLCNFYASSTCFVGRDMRDILSAWTERNFYVSMRETEARKPIFDLPKERT